MAELTENSKASKAFKKTNAKKRTPPIDKIKVKAKAKANAKFIAEAEKTLLAHYKATGRPLRFGDAEPNGSRSSYILRHGPHAGKLTVSAFNARLMRAETSVAKLNEKLANKHKDFSYHNHMTDKGMDIGKARETCLAHYKATGKSLIMSAKKGPKDKRGSYILKHGPLANNKRTAGALGASLGRAGTSIAKLNEELAVEHEGFEYSSNKVENRIDIDKAKGSLLAHCHATGRPLFKSTKEGANGLSGSYILKHGPYAEGRWLRALSLDIRLEEEGSSIFKLYISILNDLGIEGRKNKERMRDLIKILKKFTRDTFDQFDGDKKKAKDYFGKLTLDDYYKALKSYVPVEPKSLCSDQPVLVD